MFCLSQFSQRDQLHRWGDQQTGLLFDRRLARRRRQPGDHCLRQQQERSQLCPVRGERQVPRQLQADRSATPSHQVLFGQQACLVYEMFSF